MAGWWPPLGNTTDLADLTIEDALTNRNDARLMIIGEDDGLL
jgi:hypothetical protein